MPGTKKNTSSKKHAKKRVKKVVIVTKSKVAAKSTLFSNKLKKVNALLKDSTLINS